MSEGFERGFFHLGIEALVFVFNQLTESAGTSFADGRIEKTAVGLKRLSPCRGIDVQHGQFTGIAGEPNAAMRAAGVKLEEVVRAVTRGARSGSMS